MKNTMRYLSMAALALVGALTAGCSSDDNIVEQPQQPDNKSNMVTLTTTVSMDGGAATRALSSGGVKTFAAGETMAIIYKNSSNETVKAVSSALTAGDITAGKSATFTFTLTDPDKAQNVAYIYPAAMAVETVATSSAVDAEANVNYADLYSQQDGTLSNLANKFDYCTKSGAWDGDNLPSLTLENQLAILAINLKNSTGTSDITSSITGLTLSDGTYTYNVSRSAAAGPIYVAIRPTSDATITVTATDGTKNYTKTLTSKTYTASNGYPVSWRMTEVVKPDLLSGVFSVSDSKTVKFSKGNLRYASDTWSFFDNQYDYYTSYSADALDKFGWSTSAITYGRNTSTSNGDYSGDFVDWGATMGTGWFTLSKDEWEWLLGPSSSLNPGTNCRTSSTVNGTANARYAKATVASKAGIILFPDSYTHPSDVTQPKSINTANAAFTSNSYDATAWGKMEAAGCTFLPAAGYRYGTYVYGVGSYGDYWSSKPNDTNYAYGVLFSASVVNPQSSSSRYNGYSVRLVRQVE